MDVYLRDLVAGREQRLDDDGLFKAALLVLLAALWFFMIRQMQTGGNKALSFGKSRARLLSMQQKKVTFKDVCSISYCSSRCCRN